VTDQITGAGDGGSSKGANTRSQILQVAIQLASKAGVNGLTIGELAKAVGMSKSGLFAHFNSKERLQLMVLKKAADDFNTKVLRVSFKEKRGLPRIRATLENWYRFLESEIDSPGGRVLIMSSVALEKNQGPVFDFIQDAQKKLIAALKYSADLAVDQKHFRKGIDTDLFAWSLYAFVLGFFHSRIMLQDPLAEQHLRKSFESLINYSSTTQGDLTS